MPGSCCCKRIVPIPKKQPGCPKRIVTISKKQLDRFLVNACIRFFQLDRTGADEATLSVNLDVVTAATTVLGRVAVLNTFRARIADELPKFDLARFDKLEQYAVSLAENGLLDASRLESCKTTRDGSEGTVLARSRRAARIRART